MNGTRLITTVFGVGLLRPAPGTWGSATAVAAGLVIDRFLGFPALLVATAAVMALGFWAVKAEIDGREDKDPGEIVIDEIAGQWIALLFPAAAFWARDWDGFLPWPAPLAAFLFFRLFDIWKPGPVGRADRRGDAPGVMLDDIWAGLLAGVAAMIAAALFHLPMML
jgi:phosphatidylglycerophosphatase A